MNNTNNHIIVNEYGAEIPESVSLIQISEKLKQLNEDSKNNSFIIGDILVYLNDSKNKESKTDFDKQKENLFKIFIAANKHNKRTLFGYYRVAKAYSLEDRETFKHLSFTHLDEAITLTKEPEQARQLLRIAAKDDLPVSKMRAYYRTSIKEISDEPKVPVSPILPIISLCQQLERKIKILCLTDEHKTEIRGKIELLQSLV